jgi:hypothetical protein
MFGLIMLGVIFGAMLLVETIWLIYEIRFARAMAKNACKALEGFRRATELHRQALEGWQRATELHRQDRNTFVGLKEAMSRDQWPVELDTK